MLGSAHFSDALPPTALVEVASTWKQQCPPLVDSSDETLPIAKHDRAMQSRKQRHCDTQTDGTTAHKQHEGSAALPQFLDRVMPAVVQELEDVASHRSLPWLELQASTQDKPTCLHSLRLQPEGASSEACLEVMCTSWSCTGQTIAVGYGRHNAVGWCTSKGALATWNLFREDVKESKPDVQIEVDSSVTACAFHPQHPALIAGGTFNGMLYVWDLSREGDKQHGTSDRLGESSHLEPIKAVYWQHSMLQATRHAQAAYAYRIITLGADGKVLVWLWHKLGNPIYGYELSWPMPGRTRDVVWGATCFAFQHVKAGDATTCVVGTEGGAIFKCYLDYSELMAKDFPPGKDRGMRSVVKDAGYDPHAGPVLGTDCSPYQPELFATCGCDGTVRIFHLLKKQSLMLVSPCSQPLNAVQWSPWCASTLATASGDGRVYVYDVLKDTSALIQPVLVLDVSFGQSPVHCISHNHKVPGWLAAGDSHTCQVWKLPPYLTRTPPKQAANLLKRFGAVFD